jgi:serine protease
MYLGTFHFSKISAGLLLAAASTATHAIKPSDTLYDTSINLGFDVLPIYYQWSLPALNLEAAWDLATGHAYLGTLDSGIDIDHPDLVGNFRQQFSYDAYDPSDVDDDGFYNVDGNAFHRSQLNYSIGHGTHAAGIMAAMSNNGIGTAGVCWNCSLMVSQKYGDIVEAGDNPKDKEAISRDADGINWLVNNGAQVLNFSFGGSRSAYLLDENLTCDTLPEVYWQPGDVTNKSRMLAAAKYCDALAYADEFDVVVVAASGNGNATNDDNYPIQFPASEPSTIAVGAVDINDSATPSAGSVAIANNDSTPIQFNNGPEKDLVAPGFNILSTFYDNAYWNDITGTNSIWHPECADYIDQTTTNTPNTVLRPNGDGYGPCSGTSMAAPHVSGIVGLLRSINPLLKKDQIKEALIKHARQTGNDNDIEGKDDIYGYGIPDAFASVKDVLGQSNGQQLVNRLTPLFSLYSAHGYDHFYTTKPQMAMAAMYGQLQPQPITRLPEMAGTEHLSWYPTTYEDPKVPGYNSFPKPGFWWSDIPRASAYILTTHTNPFTHQSDLVPLYRLSFQGAHDSNVNNVDHTYATNQTEIDAYVAAGYQLDGIEGYIFSKNEVQPEGTVRLYRKYNYARDDHAIFPETQLSEMASKGYTQNSLDEWIGYVFLNQDSDSDGLIDGFERIVGTKMDVSDSDNDGISDGIEVNSYPYTDPMDTIPNPIAVATFLKESQPRWLATNFSEQFLDTTILFSQMQSFNGSDPASLRMRNLTSTGFDLLLEEEQSADTELGHANEVIGLLGLREGEILDRDGNAIGESGLITSNTSNGGDWKTLIFSRSYENPVLLMEMVTFNGGQPAHLRLKNVSSTGAQYQIEEWDYLDGGHASETIGYIVLEQGTQTLHDGHSIQAGVTAINHHWADISFEDMGGQPVVFSQSQTYNGGQAIVTRQREIVSNGFQVRLQEEEANDGAHAIETVGYLVIQ